MEEAPAFYQLKPEIICSKEIIIGDIRYNLSIGKTNEDEIIFEAISDDPLVTDNYSSSNLSLSAIQSYGKIFKYCETLSDVLDTIKNLFSQKSFSAISSPDYSYLNLNFISSLPTGKQEESSIKLLKKIIDKEKGIEQLFREVRTLKNENTSMKIEIENLKNDTTSLKEKNEALQEEVNELKKKIKSILEVTTPIAIENKKVSEKQIELIKTSSLITGIEEIKLLIEALHSTHVFARIEFTRLNFALLYSTSRDDWSTKGFHQKVDGFTNTLILIRTSENFIFGGFTTKKWNQGQGYLKDDDNAFVISFDTMKYYPIIKGKEAIYTNYKGPCFNSYNFIIYINDFNLRNGGKTTEAKNSYYEGLSKDYEINGGKQKFDICQIDVIQISY